MSENTQLVALRLLGFIAAAGALITAALLSKGPLGALQPFLAATFTTLVGWYVGKLTERPLPIVTLHALSEMPPPLAAQAAERLTSIRPPPLPKAEHAQVVE